MNKQQLDDLGDQIQITQDIEHYGSMIRDLISRANRVGFEVVNTPNDGRVLRMIADTQEQIATLEAKLVTLREGLDKIFPAADVAAAVRNSLVYQTGDWTPYDGNGWRED